MPRPANVSFSDHLKVWRHDRRLSQAELGKLLDVSNVTINRWEHGETPRDIDLIESKLRDLQVAHKEPPALTKDMARMLWSG